LQNPEKKGENREFQNAKKKAAAKQADVRKRHSQLPLSRKVAKARSPHSEKKDEG
jgi:hypothetical protein